MSHGQLYAHSRPPIKRLRLVAIPALAADTRAILTHGALRSLVASRKGWRAEKAHAEAPNVGRLARS